MYQDLLEKLNELKDYEIAPESKNAIQKIADTPNENIYVLLGGTYKTAYNDERLDNILNQITSKDGTYTVVCSTHDRTFIPRIMETAFIKNNLQIVLIGKINYSYIAEVVHYAYLIEKGKLLHIHSKDDTNVYCTFNDFIEFAHTLGDTHRPYKHILVDIQYGNYQRAIRKQMQTHQLFVVWLPREKEENYSANVELAEKLGINIHTLTNQKRLELNENIIRRIDKNYGNK
jgi:hypothetical protein